MAGWIDGLLGRMKRTRDPRVEQGGRMHAVSFAEDRWQFDDGITPFIGMPNETPFFMLHVYRFLRDTIPDVSDGVWTWKRLCQTGFDVDLVDVSSEYAERRARLNGRVNSGDRGMDGLLDVFYSQLFTYGAAAMEIVLTNSREQIHDIVPVDVWTVRFRRKDGELFPYQVVNGEEIALPKDRFIYVGMDRDGTNPYGRSMLRALPFVIKIQQRLMEDMAKATHNAGWSKLHVSYAPGEKQRSESAENYVKRIDKDLEDLRTTMTGLDPDQNLITHDNVKVNLIRGDQQTQVFYGNHKAVEEQVITGMHLMPVLMGRNYGTTETYGTAQYEIVNRQVQTVNRSVKRVLERLYNFELALMWGEARAKVRMRANRTVDVLKEAEARAKEIDNALRLEQEGYIDRDRASGMLGLG